MTAEARLLSAVAAGNELIERERGMLARGEFAEVARLSAGKQALLAELESAIRHVRGTGELRDALEHLISASRRNERMILAARQGVAQARRRIDAIVATMRGAVAYDRDGAQITSRDDGAKKSSRA